MATTIAMMRLSMADIPAITPANYRGDHPYTLNAMVEELTLVERHLRDGSWKLCRCNPEKHLPMLAGLASEGYGFAEEADEKEFMRLVRDYSRIMREKIEDGKFTDADAEGLRAWAREMRHRIEYKKWRETIPDNPELSDNELSVVAEIHGLTGSLADMEERQVDAMLTKLSEAHGIQKPKVTFINKCNPLTDAYQVGFDRILTNDNGEERRVPVIDRDELIFCRGSTSPYAVAHEFCHVLDRATKGKTDEHSATLCALSEVGNTSGEGHLVETLNNLHGTESSGGRMTFQSQVMGYLPLVGGVLVGEIIASSNQLDTFLQPFTGTWTNLAKAVVGIALIGFAGWKLKNPIRDVVIGIGLPIAALGIQKQFMPSLGLGYSGLGYAPSALSPYAAPTGLRYGHPTLSVVSGPRPGILAPSGLNQGLSGIWVLGQG
jgi:hypothetical protein